MEHVYRSEFKTFIIHQRDYKGAQQTPMFSHTLYEEMAAAVVPIVHLIARMHIHTPRSRTRIAHT